MRMIGGLVMTLCIWGTCLAAAPATDVWIASLEGGWSGEENATPMGQMGFAMLFERQENGSMRSHTALNRETYVELVFRKTADGRWLIDERAAMEGLGEQAYTLEPVEAPGVLRRWVYAERPGFLSVDIALEQDSLFVNVLLRGAEHVQFRLERVPSDDVAALREELARGAERSPEERSIHSLANDRTVPPAILQARAAVAAAPVDARAHLELGMAIGPLLAEDPMGMGPLYAPEMLSSLRRAVELDPTMPEGYQWLAGYYLNAPPIAGGSIDKAEELARKLAEIDPESAAAVLAQVAQSRATAE